MKQLLCRFRGQPQGTAAPSEARSTYVPRCVAWCVIAVFSSGLGLRLGLGFGCGIKGPLFPLSMNQGTLICTSLSQRAALSLLWQISDEQSVYVTFSTRSAHCRHFGTKQFIGTVCETPLLGPS